MTTAIHKPCGTVVEVTPDKTYEIVSGSRVWVRISCPRCATPFNLSTRKATAEDLKADWHYLPTRLYVMLRRYQHLTAPSGCHGH